MEPRNEKNNIASLLKSGARVLNFGMTGFHDDLREQGVPSVHMDWTPKTADKKLLAKLKELKGS